MHRAAVASAQLRTALLSHRPAAVVLIPSTGTPAVRRAVESVLAQSEPSTPYVICDGPEHSAATSAALAGIDVPVCVLPRNVGGDGFCGHRAYAAFAHLVDEDYVLFLDEDNFFGPDHVAQCVELISAQRLQWCYSLRNACEPDGSFLARDDCESLGKWPGFGGYQLIDTNTYCVLRTVLLQVAHAWHGKWGQDRVFAGLMMERFPAFACTGRYTVQYCLGGRHNSITSAFFEHGNAVMRTRYPDGFPWRSEASGLRSSGPGRRSC
jgi:hypothetical protein